MIQPDHDWTWRTDYSGTISHSRQNNFNIDTDMPATLVELEEQESISTNIHMDDTNQPHERRRACCSIDNTMLVPPLPILWVQTKVIMEYAICSLYGLYCFVSVCRSVVISR